MYTTVSLKFINSDFNCIFCLTAVFINKEREDSDLLHLQLKCVL